MKTDHSERRKFKRASTFLAAVGAALGTCALIVPQAGAAGIVPSQPSTILTIEPLNNNNYVATPNSLGGVLCMAPHTCDTVPSEASLDPSHKDGVFGEEGPISRAAANLDEMLNESDGPVVVMGRSQGSTVGGFWLRNYAPNSSVDKDKVSFLFMADPENTYGVPWAPRVPTNTGYQVTELWVQYDGWADWPTRWYPIAVANAVMGMFTVHVDAYYDLDPHDPSIIEWSANGIDYKMAPNSRLPLLDPLRNMGMGWLADILNDPLKERVEAAYDRPNSQEEADALFPAAEAEEPVATTSVSMDSDSDATETGSTETGTDTGTDTGTGSSESDGETDTDTDTDTDTRTDTETGTDTDTGSSESNGDRDGSAALASGDNDSDTEAGARRDRKQGRDNDTASSDGSSGGSGGGDSDGGGGGSSSDFSDS